MDHKKSTVSARVGASCGVRRHAYKTRVARPHCPRRSGRRASPNTSPPNRKIQSPPAARRTFRKSWCTDARAANFHDRIDHASVHPRRRATDTRSTLASLHHQHVDVKPQPHLPARRRAAAAFTRSKVTCGAAVGTGAALIAAWWHSSKLLPHSNLTPQHPPRPPRPPRHHHTPPHRPHHTPPHHRHPRRLLPRPRSR